MNTDAEAVKEFYQQRPFPTEGKSALSEKNWKLAPLAWWNALARPGKGMLKNGRILVAGCGTGNEAFTVARQFPDCEVTGVDFSSRSIEIAEKWRGEAKLNNVKFLTADLADPSFPKMPGGGFDMISCHGVMSYIPDPVPVLRHLGECLKPEGSLYLGVNGAAHFSERVRSALPFLGMDPAKFTEPELTRRVVKFCENIAQIENGPSSWPDNELAGELFGPCIHNLPLQDWLGAVQQAGLHFLSSLNTTRRLNAISEETGLYILLVHNRPAIHVVTDELFPSAFHTILLTREEFPSPSFAPDQVQKLLAWRPLVELWDRKSLPEVEPAWDRSLSKKIDISGVYRELEVELTHYHVELLRRADGTRSLKEIISEIPFPIEPVNLLPDLAKLYHTALLNFLPPAP